MEDETLIFTFGDFAIYKDSHDVLSIYHDGGLWKVIMGQTFERMLIDEIVRLVRERNEK